MTELTLEDVLRSKIYVQERSNITFGSPRAYIEPFLEKFKNFNGVEFTVETAASVINKEESGATNEAYGRVLVQAKLPSQYDVNEHSSIIGLVYALDIVKPVIKVFSGENAWACMNLSIFGAQYVHTVDILSGTSSIYSRTESYVKSVEEQLAEFQKMYERLNDRTYKGQEINELLGHLLREGVRNKNLGILPITYAARELENEKSKYAIVDNSTTAWNVYSALTNFVTDKVDIAEKANKTLMISNLFHDGF
jgi:hypothetical protein